MFFFFFFVFCVYLAWDMRKITLICFVSSVKFINTNTFELNIIKKYSYIYPRGATYLKFETFLYFLYDIIKLQYNIF